MPIYEYSCRTCGHRFEEIRKMSDDSPAKCPTCLSEDSEKLISRSAFVLKGSGWYQTDYGSKSGSAPASDNEPSPDPSPAPSSSSDD